MAVLMARLVDGGCPRAPGFNSGTGIRTRHDANGNLASGDVFACQPKTKGTLG